MSINARYRMLQGSYWMIYCPVSSYITLFLLARGLSAGQIGIIVAAAMAGSATMQPILGRISDRNVRFGWKPMLTGIGTLAVALAVGVCFCRNALLSGVMSGLLLMSLSVMSPFVNAANFDYVSRGEKVDFGFARGMGSLCYAGMSMLMGYVLARTAPDYVVYFSMGTVALFLIVAFTMPYTPRTLAPAGTADAPRVGVVTLLRRYPAYTLMLIGSVLLFSFHSIANTFLLQIIRHAGGDSDSLGVCLSISALMELPPMLFFSKIIRRYRADSLMVTGAAAFLLKSVLYLCATTLPLVWVAQTLQMFSYAVFASASVYYAAQTMAPEDSVTGQALMTCTMAIGSVVGSLLGGWVVEAFGVTAMKAMGVGLSVAGLLMTCLAVRRGRRA